MLLNLGRLDEIENNPSFQRLGLRLLELSKAKGVAKLDDFSEAQIKNWGYTVYQKIWQKFELPAILRALPVQRKVQFDLAAACFLMAVQHLLEPRSKLGTYCRQHRYFNLPEVSLNHLYRSLDLLGDYKETLEEKIFQLNRHLFNMQVDVIIVADRGINSKLNLKRIVDRGYGYIVAARLKSMGREIIHQVLAEDGYVEIADKEGEVFKYKVIDHLNTLEVEEQKHSLPEKLIITYSSSNKRGGKKYLTPCGGLKSHSAL